MKKIIQLFSCAIVCTALILVTGCTSTRQIEEKEQRRVELEQKFKSPTNDSTVSNDSEVAAPN